MDESVLDLLQAHPATMGFLLRVSSSMESVGMQHQSVIILVEQQKQLSQTFPPKIPYFHLISEIKVWVWWSHRDIEQLPAAFP